MKALRETERWLYLEDPLHGTTMLSHKTIPEISTLWNTGQDAIVEKEIIADMTDDEFIVYCNLQTKDIPLSF